MIAKYKILSTEQMSTKNIDGKSKKNNCQPQPSKKFQLTGSVDMQVFKNQEITRLSTKSTKKSN